MVAVREKVRRVLARQFGARRLPPLLLRGETGTGKGLLARACHQAGPRAGGPFVTVNCAAIPESLLEAELFGFERGAFTDARQGKLGLFYSARGGTIFLDEIGLLAEPLQAKLLTFLDDRVVRRLGSTRAEPVDLWVMAATSLDLETAVQEGQFREDLYHRLAVLSIHLPPLREREGDILLLADQFLAQACRDYGFHRKTLTAEARAALLTHPWPGNVRELANVMERAALLSETIEIGAGVLALRGTRLERPPETALRAGPAELPAADIPPAPADYRASLDRLERAQLLEALGRTGWNISHAAAQLGVPRNTLRYRIAKHQLGRDKRARQARDNTRGTPSSGSLSRADAVTVAAPATHLRAVSLLRVTLAEPGAAVPPWITSQGLDLVADKVGTFGGQVVARYAAGLDAAFGLEPAEDAPGRAAGVALAVRRLVERAQVEHAGLRVACAIETLTCPVEDHGMQARIEPGALQEALDVLAAVVDGAEEDAIVVGPRAVPYLERHFVLADGLAPDARGRAQLVRREGVDVDPGHVSPPRRSPFVGRAQEITFLEQRLGQVASTGRGHIVGLMGEPGMGKSRLLAELRQVLTSRGVSTLMGRCASHATAVPYSLLLDLVRQTWHLDDMEPPDVLAFTVSKELEAIGLVEGVPEILALLGLPAKALTPLSPEAVKARTFETLRRLLLAHARAEPLAVLLEDLHWADQTSQEFLALLTDSLPGAPVLVVVTTRPGYRAPWLDRSWASQLALPPLSLEDSRNIVRTLRPELSAAAADALARRAEGNPFFLEELASVVADGSTTEMSIPGTVTDALRARMDRLPAEARRVLETAAVLGREAPLALLDPVTGTPAESLVAPLTQLVAAEFVYEQPGPTLVFKHALTQEVAYDSLTFSDRARLHAVVGRTLESLFAGRLDEVLDRLAHHWGRTEDHARAVEYLSRLAVRMLSRYELSEVVERLTAALGHADAMAPGLERDRAVGGLVWRFSLPLLMLGRPRDAISLVEARRASVDRAADPLIAGPYYFYLAYLHNHCGNRDPALKFAERALAEGRRARDPLGEGGAHHVLGFEAFWRGQFARGAEHERLAAELLARTSEPWLMGGSHWLRAMNLIAAGHFGPALAAVADTQAVAERSQDRRHASYASWMIGWVLSLRGERAASLEAYRVAAEQAPDPLALAAVTAWSGHAQLEADDIAAAVATLRSTAERFRNFGVASVQGLVEAWLAEAELRAGRPEAARELASSGLQLSVAAGFPYGLGVAQRAMGAVVLAEGDARSALGHLGEALETFSRIEASYEVARTHVLLARGERARGDLAAAATHLDTACRLFADLDVPRWVERTVDIARELDIAVDHDAGGDLVSSA
jgi:DNA-binding NtrC family response regulator/tetratricopeptide (TPR) repeat protein